MSLCLTRAILLTAPIVDPDTLRTQNKLGLRWLQGQQDTTNQTELIADLKEPDCFTSARKIICPLACGLIVALKSLYPS